jgi:hypothetical protein
MPHNRKKISENWLECTLLYLTLGAIAPLAFFLCAWWGSFLFGAVEHIPFFMLSGLGFGLLVDIFFLSRWVAAAYSFHPFILSAIYLFYSIGLFGFFMGVPAFIILLGPLAGLYIGRRLQLSKANGSDLIIRRTSIFTSAVSAVACLASLVLAAMEKTLAANINGMLADMLGLHLALNNRSILIFSVIAGVGLVVLEYFLTRLAAFYSLKQRG